MKVYVYTAAGMFEGELVQNGPAGHGDEDINRLRQAVGLGGGNYLALRDARIVVNGESSIRPIVVIPMGAIQGIGTGDATARPSGIPGLDD
ncbi:hypothetical protein [Deinococcus sonorensis]|uniref:Uncharacterized protein n=2 Tax=Deinococcus sonorensis TaxID=309891 RepID=A0AAU7U862_9DEIO